MATFVLRRGDSFHLPTHMVRRKNPPKRSLAQATDDAPKRRRFSQGPFTPRIRSAPVALSCAVDCVLDDSLRLQVPLRPPRHAVLFNVLSTFCSDFCGGHLLIDLTLQPDDRVTLQVREDANESSQRLDEDVQVSLADLFPGTYEAWRPNVVTLVEMKLLAVHIAASREAEQRDWSFHLAVRVAWRDYMALCEARGLVPVLASPKANPARAVHQVMIWLLKQVHDAGTGEEAVITFRYWNEVEVQYDRFVGDNAAACAHFKEEVFEMPEIYARIDAGLQLSRDVRAYESMTSAASDLLPTLRPYQKAAVSWMLSRERPSSEQASSLPLSVSFSESVARGLQAYDPFCAGFHASALGSAFDEQQKQLRPTALNILDVRGGILADEMGLGKTVEVIALMLSHRRPSLTPGLLSIHTTRANIDDEKIGGIMACICGSTDEHPSGSVQCTFCGTLHHRLCTGFSDSPYENSVGLWIFDVASSSSNEKSWSTGEFMCYHCQSNERPIFASHTTLIVSPEPIHSQWENELSRHVRTGALSVIRYPGVRALRARLEGIGPSAEWQILASPGLRLSQYDVVLTTYEALAADLRHIPTVEGGARRSSTRSKHKRYAFVGSPLVGLHFWRVCMDEAQVGVENTRLQAALTVSRISAKYRWVVTGTPFSSRVEELFGYLRFLRVSPYSTAASTRGTVPQEHCQLQQELADQKEVEALDMSFFREAIERCFNRGAIGRVLDLLLWNGRDNDANGGGILWRTGKKHVLDQLVLPPQKNEVIWCRFAAVERHFYDQQERHIMSLVQQRQRAREKDSESSDVIDRNDGLWQDLLILRQLCCHPQVGGARQAWGASGNSTNGAVMTMDAFLLELVSKAKRECEEAQRQLIGAQNGLAALLVLEHNFSAAALKYMALMRLIRSNWPHFRADLLPRLHILQNLEKCVRALYAVPDAETIIQGEANSVADYDSVEDPKTVSILPELPTLEKRISSAGLAADSDDLDSNVRASIGRECALIRRSARYIRQFYLLQAESLHSQALAVFQDFSHQIDSEQNQNSSGSNSTLLCIAGNWWNSALAIIDESGQDNKQQLLSRIHARLSGFGTRWGTSFCSQLVSLRSLRLLLVRELEALAERRRKLIDRLVALSNPPTDSDVELSGNCSKCREAGIGPVCAHCQLYKDLDAYRRHFLGIDKTAATKANFLDLLADDEDDESCEDNSNPTGQGKSGRLAVSLFVEVFKEISTCAVKALRVRKDGRAHTAEIQAATQQETEFWARLQREWQMAKRLFQAQHHRLGALDELTMACSQLRLRQPGEPEASTKAEMLSKLEPAEVPVRAEELETDRAVADHELNDKMSQLRYLFQLQREAESHQPQQDGTSVDTPTLAICAVCLQELAGKRGVLPCAHVFCQACVKKLAGGSHKRSTVRCPTCRRLCSVNHVTEIVDESAASGGVTLSSGDNSADRRQTADSRRAGGSLGSKLDALLGRVDFLRQDNPAVKCLLFSQWSQMLELAVKALPQLGVRCFMCATKSKLPVLLSQFRACPSACVLALPFKIGANGLNIVEATEVLLIEPLLSPSIEAQAVNRVHRMGQTRRTRVHRFIVQGSIEERIFRLGHKQLARDADETKDDEELPRLGVAPGRKEHEKLTMQDLQELLNDKRGSEVSRSQGDAQSETDSAFWEELVLLNDKDVSRNAACELLERRHAAEIREGGLLAEREPKTRVFGKLVALTVAAELLELSCSATRLVEPRSSLSQAVIRHRDRVQDEIRVWRSSS